MYKIEEKGSDVNLAAYLLDDCFTNDFDEAVVISNDSDLALPIELVTTKYRKGVWVINPHPTSRKVLKTTHLVEPSTPRLTVGRC